MNRFEAVSVAVVAALALGGLGLKYSELRTLAQAPDPVKTPVAAVPAPTLESVVRAFLAEDGAPGDRLPALGEMISSLSGPKLQDEDLKPGDAETLGRAVASVLDTVTADAPDGLELKRQAVAFLARRVPSPSSRDLVLKTMEDGPQALRDEAIKDSGFPRGVRGPAVYREIVSLSGRGLVPPELLPEALRRTGGLKARGELLAILKSTDSPTLLSGCAVALQDYRDPEVLGPVLERLEQTGRLDSAGKLPWLSGPLLSDYLKTADKDDFRRGLVAMSVRPGLARPDPLRRGLDSPDAVTRGVAAVAVKKAVVAGVLDPKVGEEMLALRLKTEREPVLKAELTGGLERVRGLLPKTTQQ